MKAVNIKHLGYALIILQMFAYYGGTPIPFTNVNYSMLNERNISFFISTILGENFFLLLGIILIAVYWFKFKKKSNVSNDTTDDK